MRSAVARPRRRFISSVACAPFAAEICPTEIGSRPAPRLHSARAQVGSLVRPVKIFTAFSAALSLLALAPAARAADPISVEDRLRALEAKIETLSLENAALRRALTAPPRPVADAVNEAAPPASALAHDHPTSAAIVVPAPSGQETRLTLGGFTQMQAEFGGLGDARFAGAGDRIYARRARLFFGGSFSEHFEFRVDGEFGASTVAPTSGIRASANEILLGWNRYPGASVRIGQLKPAFSAELLGTEYKGPLVERSLGAERLGDGRQVGVAVNGDFFGARAGYLVFVGNGTGSNTSANDNRKFLQTARVYAVPFDSPAAGKLTLGADALHSTDAALNKAIPEALGPRLTILACLRNGNQAD